MSALALLAWLLAGIAVLAIAYLVRPRQDPLALGPTILAGIGGAVLGGMVATLVGGEEGTPGLRTIFSTSAGAMLAMLLFRLNWRSRRTK
ncbi:MAG TPA: hypothetical protein VMS86_05055 [Thermoanaerobaculia bacterium]|nr:hypothetical protein [Thermoanaerobaculia bacterium]